jgi:hypothetical protein
MLKKAVMAYFKVLSGHFAAANEENHRKSQDSRDLNP